MRCIDADALIKQMEADAEQMEDPIAKMFTYAAINDVKHAPTIEPEPCEDAVSRHRLLNDLKELIAAWEKYPVMAEEIKGVEAEIGYVKTIPSVMPERNTGKWNFIGDQMFECTKCGTCYTQSQFHQMRVRITDSEFPKFCPNCGCQMERSTE